MKRLLLVASSVAVQRSVMRAGRALDLAVVAAADLADGGRAARGAGFTAGLVVVQDLVEDVSVTQALLDELAPSPVVLLAAHEEVPRALELLKAGFADLIRLPLQPELLVHRLRQLLLSSRSSGPEDGAAGEGLAGGLLGDSRAMQEVRARLAKLAATDLPVAIYGESGTGKELAARTIHALSSRSVGPFVVANCAAMPESLFENELFGHERGSYTGAGHTTGGLVEEAAGGTLVLDEIGELALPLQSKLLRFLQFGTYRRVGGTQELHSDVRIVASTNRFLPDAVAEKTFRADLFYRIHLLHAVMPPLRERVEDIGELVAATTERFCRRHDRVATPFTPAAIAKLSEHRWPGNVRELEGVVQTTLALNDGTTSVGPELVDLPSWETSTASSRTPGFAAVPEPATAQAPHTQGQERGVADVPGEEHLSQAKQRVIGEFEVRYVTRILSETGGNVAEAARQAGTDRKTLWRLLRKHDIDVLDFKRRSAGRGATES